MKCVQCGCSVVEGDLICPNCGAQLALQQPSQTQEPAVNEPTPVEPVTEEEKISAEAPVVEAPAREPMDEQPEEQLELNTQPQAAPEKGKGKLFALIGVGVVLLAAILALILNAGAVSGWFVRTFSSGHDLMAKVYSDALCDTIHALYTDLSAQELIKQEESYAGELHIQPGQQLLDVVGLALSENEVDTSWLSDIVLAYDAAYDTQSAQAILRLALGDHTVLSGECIIDPEKMDIWCSIPQLSSQALYIQGSEMDVQYSSAAIQPQDLIAMLPDEKTATEIAKAYTTFLVDWFDNVSKSKQTVTIGDLSQSITVLKACMTEEAMTRGIMILLEHMKTDGNIKQLIVNFVKQINEQGAGEPLDSEQIYNDFLQSLDQALAELSEDIPDCDPENILTVYTYLDNRNQICGYEVFTQDESGIRVLTLKKGSSFANEIILGDTVISGSGKIGVNSQGKWTLCVDDREYITVLAEDIQVADGSVTGKITLDPNAVLVKEIVLGVMEDENMASMAAMLDVKLVVSLSQDQVHICLTSGEASLFAISYQQKASQIDAIKIPTNYVDITDADALAAWSENLDAEGFLNNLVEAGVPAEILLMLLMSMSAGM